LDVNRGGWNLGLGELTLGKAADIFVDVLANGLTSSFGGFLDDAPGVGFYASN
jgi:hypothetical protein